MAKIIEAADARGMVVLVGCLYWGHLDRQRMGWSDATQTAGEQAIAKHRYVLKTTARECLPRPDNEGMSPFTDAILIAADCRRPVHDRVAIEVLRALGVEAQPIAKRSSTSTSDLLRQGLRASRGWERGSARCCQNYWAAYSKTPTTTTTYGSAFTRSALQGVGDKATGDRHKQQTPATCSHRPWLQLDRGKAFVRARS